MLEALAVFFQARWELTPHLKSLCGISQLTIWGPFLSMYFLHLSLSLCGLQQFNDASVLEGKKADILQYLIYFFLIILMV